MPLTPSPPLQEGGASSGPLLSSHCSGSSSQADLFISLACDAGLDTHATGSSALGLYEGASPRSHLAFHHCLGASPPRSRRGSHDGGQSPLLNHEWSPKQPRKRLGRWSFDGNGCPPLDEAVWERLKSELGDGGNVHWLAEQERRMGHVGRLHAEAQGIVGDVEAAVWKPLLLHGGRASERPDAEDVGRLLMTPRRKRRWLARTQSSLRIAWENSRLSFSEIPEWMRDNCLIQVLDYFIEGSYRPQLTLAAAARSAFSLHNETFNVWSHVAGFALSLLVLLAIAREQPPTTPADPAAAAPKWPMFVSLATSMYLYAASSAAHLFHVIGKTASDVLWKLDHTAIAAACAGAFFPICTYAFSCVADATTIYLGVTCVLAAAVVCVSMLPAFHMPKYRPVRTAVQLSFGLWAQVPLLHATWLLLKYTAALSALLLVYTALGVLVLGAVIFASRATDRLFHGRVDLIGSSHNILHALVVVSNLLFIAGARELWLWRNSVSGTC